MTLVRLKRVGRTLQDYRLRFGSVAASHYMLFQSLCRHHIVRVGICTARSIDEALREGPRVELSGFTARQLSTEEVRACVARGEDWFYTSDLERSIARGDKCWGAFDGDVLVSSIWFAAERRNQLGLNLQPPPVGNIGHRMITRPDYRGRRISEFLKDTALKKYWKSGIRWASGTVFSTNYPSLASSRHRGGRWVGLIVQLGPDSWRCSWMLSFWEPHLHKVEPKS